MIELKEQIYEFLDSYCIGLTFDYDLKFKRFVTMETNSTICFHVSVSLGNYRLRDSNTFSGVFLISIFSNEIVVSSLDKINFYKGHTYNSFKAYSIDEFKDIIIENSDVAMLPLMNILELKIV